MVESFVNRTDIYRNVFYSERTRAVMVAGSILPEDGDAESLTASLLRRLAAAEAAMGEDRAGAGRALREFEDLLRAGVVTLGSPLLTNVAFGRPALGSCGAVAAPAGQPQARTEAAAEACYGLNMGSGYNLDDQEDPVRTLYALNAHAARLTKQGFAERYIGNMAHLSVDHPRALAFLRAKSDMPGVVHFNISLDVTDAFVSAVEVDGVHILRDGTPAPARRTWEAMVDCAWRCGDPGLVSLDRFNRDNPLPGSLPYVTTAPCAEVGLAIGQTCVFGYVNLAACLTRSDDGPDLDEGLLARAAGCLTRVLDDAVEDGIRRTSDRTAADVMARTRKIGIGVCGFADALLLMDVAYGSPESVSWLNRALSVVNFASKQASVELSARRGAYGDWSRSRHASDPGFLTRCETRASRPGLSAWRALRTDASRRGIRNSMTTALPPSGRSAILLGVNGSVEPFLTFSPSGHSPLVVGSPGHADRRRRDLGGPSRPPGDPAAGPRGATARRTALEIPASEHLAVLEEAAALVDDGVSKTVNMPSGASVSEVDAVFRGAWRAGLKAISVYRDGSIAPLATKH